eukprot:gene3332-1675_t
MSREYNILTQEALTLTPNDTYRTKLILNQETHHRIVRQWLPVPYQVNGDRHGNVDWREDELFRDVVSRRQCVFARSTVTQQHIIAKFSNYSTRSDDSDMLTDCSQLTQQTSIRLEGMHRLRSIKKIAHVI